MSSNSKENKRWILWGTSLCIGAWIGTASSFAGLFDTVDSVGVIQTQIETQAQAEAQAKKDETNRKPAASSEASQTTEQKTTDTKTTDQ